jgi:pimeloyl-ACP methyl ester carboxylesterase
MATASSGALNLAAVEASVHSSDGTRIGYVRLGTGPALVLVHGSLSSSADWLGVAELLASRFTCFVMDRRGRGLSGDSASYSIEREYEDIAAVLAAAGPEASLMGHSFGAICTLGAAMRTPVPRLILYEPPLPVGGLVAGKYLDDYREAVAGERLDDALCIGLTRFVGLPSALISAMRATPLWPHLLSLAPTWPREVEAIESLSSAVSQYAAIACPTMLLVGSESAAHPLKDASSALAQVLRNVRTTVLERQGHMAMRLAPELLAAFITQFLSESM